MYMVAKDNMPLRIVESPGFTRFCKTAVPLYKLPSRRTFTRMMDSKYEMLKKEVMRTLKDVERVCMTADAWTDSCNNKSFLGMTVHFLQNVNMKSVALAAVPLDQPHTKQYFTSEMEKVVEEWMIDKKKIDVLVTDGGANMVAAAKQMLGESKHLICVDHSLNRVITVAIERSPPFLDLLVKIRTIVTFFKKSISAADDLRAIQAQQGKSENEILKLKKDEPTRWGSNFAMLERFVELADLLSIVLLKYKHIPMLSGMELAAATEGRDFLRPMNHVITELEGECNSLSGKVIPLLKMMKTAVETQQVDTEIIIKLKVSVLEQFDRKFKDIELVDDFAVSTLLDPRFKSMYLNPISNARAIKSVSDKINHAPLNVSTRDSTCGRSIPTGTLWDLHEQLVAETNSNLPIDTPGGISGELRNFLHQPVVARTSNPLQIWNAIKGEYPHLYPIARQYLSKMVTSVPSERLFSRTGETTQNRFRLNPHRMSKLAFLGSLSDDFWI